MKFKMNLLVAAVALVAATGANATLQFGNSTTNGNSSLAFVAMSADNSTSLVVDLGASFTSLLSGGALRDTSGVTATWNFATNTYTINGVAQAGTYAYSNAAGFVTGNSASGFTWGVIGGDSVANAASPTNTVASQNVVFTTTALDFDNSVASGIKAGTVAAGAVNVDNLFAANNGIGTQLAGRFGSSTANAGAAFLGTTVAADGIGNFGSPDNFGANNFLVGLTDTAYIMRAQLAASPVISQLGSIDSVGSALDVAAAATFTFDQATQTLTYQVSAVPEPESYAMLIAGLAAVGFVARRRANR